MPDAAPRAPSSQPCLTPSSPPEAKAWHASRSVSCCWSSSRNLAALASKAKLNTSPPSYSASSPCASCLPAGSSRTARPGPIARASGAACAAAGLSPVSSSRPSSWRESLTCRSCACTCACALAVSLRARCSLASASLSKPWFICCCCSTACFVCSRALRSATACA
eukprot:scaffold71622_cov30-Phaeocystis_antarctica.AAC.1